MKIGFIFLALLVLSGYAVALEPVKLKQFGTDMSNFTSAQISNQIRYTMSKYAVQLHKYEKKYGKAHPLLKGGLSKRFLGEANPWNTISINSDSFFGAKFRVGLDEVFLIPDTGSSDIVINHDAYNPHHSLLSSDTKTGFALGYGDGSNRVEAHLYTDVFNIGGVSGITCRGVPVGHSNGNFMNYKPMVGILGLGFKPLSGYADPYEPLMYTLKKKHKVRHNLFQLTMRRGDHSELHFGAIDFLKVKGLIGFVDVDPSKGFWELPAKVNGKKITALLDSGTTGILGPKDQVEEVLKNMDGVELGHDDEGHLKGYVDCANPPEVKIKIAHKEIKLGKHSVISGIENGDSKCYMSIFGQSLIPNFDGWILGTHFFTETSIIFDVGNHRVGIAEQTPDLL